MIAEEALQILLEGNKKYIETTTSLGDVSLNRRMETARNGQHPLAIVITCSDARVIPESIFSCGIGDLFVIRVAGNVMDDHQLGSIEYAAHHLGCHLVIVLGHDHCGAVDAAMNHNPDGYIKYITDEIRKAIQDETDELQACILNVKHSVEIIENSIEIQHMEQNEGLMVTGAIYHIETGKVDII